MADAQAAVLVDVVEVVVVDETEAEPEITDTGPEDVAAEPGAVVVTNMVIGPSEVLVSMLDDDAVESALLCALLVLTQLQSEI